MRARRRWLVGIAAVAALAGLASTARAQDDISEESSRACANGVDDDADGMADCSDVACRAYTFCHGVDRNLSVVHTQSLVWLQVTGLVTWLSVYVAGIAVTAAVGGNEVAIGYSTVPLAGPFICMGECSNADIYMPALVSAASLQILGLIFLIAGSAIQVDYRARTFGWAPWLGPSRAGSELSFTF